MKKLLALITVLMLILTFNCSVGEKSFSITFINNTDKNGSLVFGNHTIYAGKGTSVTYYYITENKEAKISIKDIEVEPFTYFHTYPGNTIIDDGKTITGYEQLFNFQYICVVKLENGKYKWTIKSNFVGNQTDDVVFPKYLF